MGKDKFQNALTVDVEDWFHILDTDAAPQIDRWTEMESRVEGNMERLLTLFDEYNVKATFFWLGWIAERHPELLQRCHAEGHEIASHGYCHLLAYQVGPDRFYEDILKARLILEDICGAEVKGFRAAGFGITDSAQWAFEKIAEAGYQYDSSVFPAKRGHGGMTSEHLGPYVMPTSTNTLVEIPMSVAEIFGKRLPLFGGGYLRLAPWGLIDWGGHHLSQRGRPLIVYVHPREIDPDHPRLSLPMGRAFRSYVNLKSTFPKLRKLSSNYSFAPLWQSVQDVFGSALR